MRIIVLKSEENFANQINNITDLEDEFILFCSDEVLVKNDLAEKLEVILHSNEHHAVVGPVFFQCPQNQEKIIDFFDIVPFISAKCFMLRMSTLKNSEGFNPEIVDFDLCLAEYCTRINKYGYSTIQTNFGESALNEKSEILKAFTDDELLSISEQLTQYNPIATSVVRNYLNFKVDPLVHFESILAGATNKKPRLLFSFQNLMASFNGTAEYSFALLQSFMKLYGDRYEIDVIVHRDAWSFHRKNFPAQVQVFYFNQDEKNLSLYDMVFSSSQIWEMKYLYLFNRLSPRIAVSILDAIVWRSGYLDISHAGGHTVSVNRFIMRYCDGFLAISENARKDILSFFHNVDTRNLLTASALLGHDFRFQEEDKIQNRMLVKMHNDEIDKIISKKYVLVFGNGLKHKSVNEAYNALINVDIKKVYIGMDGSKFKDDVNSSFFHSGGIPDNLMQELYRKAHLLVFPSQYEGFGLPIIKAVEYKKKIILFNNEINHEVVDAFVKNDGQVKFFDLFSQLPEIVDNNLEEYSLAETKMRTWDEVARETEDFFQKILQSEISPDHLRDRWFNLKLMEQENKDFMPMRKTVAQMNDFITHATVFKKKFFPKKLF